jgi:quinolinate synthase
MISHDVAARLKQAPPLFVEPTPPAALSKQEEAFYFEQAVSLLREKDATLIAHYYVDATIQRLAEVTGGCVADSLTMARFGQAQRASTLVVAGVKFMAETAKILNPNKRIVVPTLAATCSLDLGCCAKAFARFCDEHPQRQVVVYVNTSAAVKACADWVVTSSCALDVVTALHEKGESILWAPDRYLGDYIAKETGADLLSWYGSCTVHDKFKAEGIKQCQQAYPEAGVLVHPESPADVIALADRVGSTSQLIEAAATLPHPVFIVATESGIFYKMQQVAQNKLLIAAPQRGQGAECQSCAHCPWMKLNGLKNLVACLQQDAGEVFVDEAVRQRALIPLQRMMDFSSSLRKERLSL